MATEEKKTSAAYVPWGTFKNSLDQLAQGVPNVIDRTVFTGMAWAVQSQLFAALRFLGLIDDRKKPTQELANLAGIEEDQRKVKLKEILQRRYAELFALDLKKTTPGELAQKMGEHYGVSGDTREKAVRFFTAAADYVGVELSPLFDATKKANGTAPAPRVAKRRGRPRGTRQPAVTPPSSPPAGTAKTVGLESGGTLTLTATLDLFKLNAKDRAFVFELIDKLEHYEKESETDAPPVTGE